MDEARAVKLLESINAALSDIKVQSARSEATLEAVRADLHNLQQRYERDNTASRLAVLEAKSARNDKISAGIIVGLGVSFLTALGTAAMLVASKIGVIG